MRYLRDIGVWRYGGLRDCSVGPLAPGLNVVFGPNEAGKSTVASLVGGVLFGWEDAHGVRNRYMPPEGERAGELVFCTEDEPAWRSVLARDEAGPHGDASVLDDIDRATFDAVFSFSSEELRSLGNSSDVTARLLTAASGTGSGASPASAFVEVERQVAEGTRKVLECAKELEGARELVKQASDQVERYRKEDQELAELTASRAAVLARIEEANGELEDLVAWRSELAAADERARDVREGIAQAEAERAAVAAGASEYSAFDQRILALDSTGERVLRDRIDELAERQERADRALETAKENAATSSAAYEALLELEDAPAGPAGRGPRRLNVAQAVVSVLLPIVFVAAGVPLFMHGREVGSLSFSALGFGLVISAIFLAAAALVVLFRPARGTAELEKRRQDAQWVMLQDRKKRDACAEEKAQVGAEIAAFFDECGLAGANGSVRQARTLLDEAAAARAAIALNGQRVQALDLRIHDLEEQLAHAVAARRRVEDEAAAVVGGAALAGVGAGGRVRGERVLYEDGEALGEHVLNREQTPGEYVLNREEILGEHVLYEASGEPVRSAARIDVRQLDAQVRRVTAERDALVEGASDLSQRIGELARGLDQAKSDDSFPMAKARLQALRARQRAAKHELVELLLTKRMLERAIAAWENRSQPEVYARAGRLLSRISCGRWVEVGTSATGSLVAVGPDGVERDPRHLSLGTCQQLYLALRMALLQVARDVGRSVPVLADDVLVHFDAERRAGAAAALAELAQERQVVVFTCHRETVEVLQATEPGTTVVRMG